MIPQVQLIQVTPQELTDLINEALKARFKELYTQIQGIEPKNEKEFLTRKETQALFNVSSVTIHEWQKNGILKVYKMGNRSYFKYSELLETLYKSNRL
jgi:hypothetical protein